MRTSIPDKTPLTPSNRHAIPPGLYACDRNQWGRRCLVSLRASRHARSYTRFLALPILKPRRLGTIFRPSNTPFGACSLRHTSAPRGSCSCIMHGVPCRTCLSVITDRLRHDARHTCGSQDMCPRCLFDLSNWGDDENMARDISTTCMRSVRLVSPLCKASHHPPSAPLPPRPHPSTRSPIINSLPRPILLPCRP